MTRIYVDSDDEVSSVEGLALAPGGGMVQPVPDRPADKKARVRASRRMTIMKLAEMPASALPTLVEQLQGESRGRDQAAVERVGSRTFYWVGERWIDANYDEKQKTTKVEAFSDEYFELIHKHPDLAKCFALGERVVVMLNGTTYETVPPPP